MSAGSVTQYLPDLNLPSSPITPASAHAEDLITSLLIDQQSLLWTIGVIMVSASLGGCKE